MFALLFGLPTLASQPAITGQTAGENIVYTAKPDVVLSCSSINTSPYANLDINQDGTKMDASAVQLQAIFQQHI